MRARGNKFPLNYLTSNSLYVLQTLNRCSQRDYSSYIVKTIKKFQIDTLRFLTIQINLTSFSEDKYQLSLFKSTVITNIE